MKQRTSWCFVFVFCFLEIFIHTDELKATSRECSINGDGSVQTITYLALSSFTLKSVFKIPVAYLKPGLLRFQGLSTSRYNTGPRAYFSLSSDSSSQEPV